MATVSTDVPAILKKTSGRTIRKRSNAQEGPTSATLRRSRRTMQRQPSAATKTMKESQAMLQVASGLQRQQLGLTCKENVLEAPATRVRVRKAVAPSQPQPTPIPLTSSALTFGDVGDVSMDVQVTEPSPLPKLSWANFGTLWRQMRAKDRTTVAPDTDLRIRHPGILPNMRTILLDWMMEVCEEYKLHRETYYLSVDLYDRFMDTQFNAHKEQLQLIGITCLFVASKIEEIYPPKVNEFAYVTDGACGLADILAMELVICKALNWRLNHHIVTVNTWINTYMQLGSHYLRPPGVKAKEFEYPAYSTLEFVRVMQLLDMCLLDISSRQFSSSVLSAAALYLASERSRQHLGTITGLEPPDIHLCITWMQPFATVLSQRGPVIQKTFNGVVPQDSHNIQTHNVSITMLEDALELRKSQEVAAACQFSLLQDCSVFMTPPRQERRCLAPINSTMY